MPRYDAYLVDVYETVLRVDRARHGRLLADRLGLGFSELAEAAQPWGDAISDGSATLGEMFQKVLIGCGREPTPELVADAVRLDGEIMADIAEVFADTVPFLESLRAAGMRTAFVSNCAENTRPMLDRLGLSGLVDELVLSCEVGAMKPAPRIYREALGRLGVTPERAVLVDDLAAYCEGAVALGLGAVRIDRAGGEGPDDIASLAELDPLAA